jgi:hypothetical protein
VATSITLPAAGDSNWSGVLNTAVTTVRDAADNRKQVDTVTGVKTAAYTAAPWEIVRADISGGSFPVMLPSASTRWEVAVKVLVASPTLGSTSVVVTASGTDVINVSGTTALSLSYLNQSKMFISDGAGTVTAVAGDLVKAVLDQIYAPISVSGKSAPTRTYARISFR